MTAVTARMTRAEVAAHFSISLGTLRRWVKSGKLPAPVKLGECHYWYRESIEKTDRLFREASEKNLKKRAIFGDKVGDKDA